MTRWSDVLGHVGHDILAILTPRGCAGCGKPDDVLCEACTEKLWNPVTRSLPPRLVACGKVFSCCAYDGPMRAAILRWKDHGDLEVGALFAQAMQRLVQTVVGKSDAETTSTTMTGSRDLYRVPRIAVIPAPSSPASRARRGRLQTRELAVAVTRGLSDVGVSAHVEEALALRSAASKSVRLQGVRSRQQRSTSGFRPSLRFLIPPLRRHFLEAYSAAILVDDICTTGSTILGCCRQLDSLQIPVLAVFTLASVPGV